MPTYVIMLLMIHNIFLTHKNDMAFKTWGNAWRRKQENVDFSEMQGTKNGKKKKVEWKKTEIK